MVMKLTSILLCLCFVARAQAPASDGQTLQHLLSEVHQLRIALERSTQIGPRVQIDIERLKLQQELVARVARQLDEVRRDLDHHRSEQPKIQQRLQELENAVPSDPQQQDMKVLSTHLKLDAEQTERSLQQLQTREGELVSQLQSERARLTELNDRLDQIERALNVP